MTNTEEEDWLEIAQIIVNHPKGTSWRKRVLLNFVRLTEEGD